MAQHAHRFLLYEPDLTPDEAEFILYGDEHHHLQVLRPREGEAVFVTNGLGLLVRCSFGGVDTRGSRLVIDEVIHTTHESRHATLALACLKKTAFEQAVKQCTELGVSSFVPVCTAKSHHDGYAENFVDRLRRVALSAMKQSFRSVLPAIQTAVTFEDLIARADGFDRVVVGDTAGTPLAAGQWQGSLLMVVGPEGGLTPGEIAGLRDKGAEIGSVSRHRLRSETAAAAMATLMLAGGVADGADN